MNPLNQFTNDVNMRDEVRGFIDAFIDTEAVKRIYAREDVSGIADAKELIELAFNDLINKQYESDREMYLRQHKESGEL
jgi:hypothetical protein